MQEGNSFLLPSLLPSSPFPCKPLLPAGLHHSDKKLSPDKLTPHCGFAAHPIAIPLHRPRGKPAATAHLLGWRSQNALLHTGPPPVLLCPKGRSPHPSAPSHILLLLPASVHSPACPAGSANSQCPADTPQ